MLVSTLWSAGHYIADGRRKVRVRNALMGVVVELVSGLGLIEEQSGATVESESGEVDGSAHEIARQLVQALGV